MILVGQYDSPPTRRVAVALHTLGIPFERDTRSVFADADAIRRISPLGRIPALVLDDGEVLIETGAILDHIDETVGPERALLPARGPERRRALQIIALASGILDKVAAIVYERGLRPPEMHYEPWLERCRLQTESGLAALEAVTGGGWYQDAPSPRHADFAAACVVAYLPERAPTLFPPGRYPRLTRHLAAAEALPAFRATRWASDEGMPSGL